MNARQWDNIKKAFGIAMGMSHSDRADYLRSLASDIGSEVEKLVSANDSANGFIDEPALVDLGLVEADKNDFYVGKHIDSYKIIREVGHGGMGTVYLANRADQSFDKPVAVKLIKRGMDTNSVLKRFVMERQILAQLQHPNIASLLDGGSTEDGLPYFVMEFVEGVPITKFCDAGQFTTPERLELFQQVCAAVSYAHQNLVVHRDIKPANILVKQDGTPKLLDFGVAKMLSPGWEAGVTEPTATMMQAMTPEYASPEQFQGLPITTASDVYSLGVVLYELLSGSRPYKFESRLPSDIARIVLEEVPTRPSSVAREPASNLAIALESDTSAASSRVTAENQIVPDRDPRSLVGDLDNIVLKALRKEPERRYSTVQELAEDIRRHLKGLPVSASADTFTYRISKFVKRHKAGVLAGILVLFTLSSATALTTWQAIIAGRERDKAQQRFGQVRKLAHTVLFDYHDSIEKLEGSTPLRKKMVLDAVEYLDTLYSENSGDPDLLHEIAAAYEKIGDVQGNPYSANLGDQHGALDSYNKALAVRTALSEKDPESLETKIGLASSNQKIGDMLWAMGQSAEAESHYKIALELCLALAADNLLPDRSQIASLYNRVGQTREQVQEFDGALESYSASLTFSQNLLAGDPENVKYRRGVAIGNAKIGDVYYQLNRFAEASECYGRSLSILEKLVADDPVNTGRRRDIGLILTRAALGKMKAGQFAEAVSLNQRAVAIQKQILESDPNNSQIRFDLADTLSNLGEALEQNGNSAAADETFRDCISNFKDSLAKNPGYAQGRDHFGSVYLTFGRIQLKRRNGPAAHENFLHAQTIFEAEATAGDSLKELSEVYEGLADSGLLQSASIKAVKEARDLYDKSQRSLTELSKKRPLGADDSARLTSLLSKIQKYDAVIARH